MDGENSKVQKNGFRGAPATVSNKDETRAPGKAQSQKRSATVTPVRDTINVQKQSKADAARESRQATIGEINRVQNFNYEGAVEIETSKANLRREQVLLREIKAQKKEPGAAEKFEELKRNFSAERQARREEEKLKAAEEQEKRAAEERATKRGQRPGIEPRPEPVKQPALSPVDLNSEESIDEAIQEREDGVNDLDKQAVRNGLARESLIEFSEKALAELRAAGGLQTFEEAESLTVEVAKDIKTGGLKSLEAFTPRPTTHQVVSNLSA